MGWQAVNNILANTVVVFGPAGTVEGVFVYAPGTTPALGNPPDLWVTDSTKDPYGNVLPATGIGSRAGNAFSVMQFGQLLLGNVTYNSQGLVNAGGVGGPDNKPTMDIASPLALGTDVQAIINLITRAAGHVPIISLSGAVQIVDGLTVTSGETTDTLHVTGASALDGAITTDNDITINDGTNNWIADRTQTDRGIFTVTQAVLTDISKAWQIPANDGQASGQSTVYRLKVGGFGVQGSTVQNLTMQVTAFGQAFCSRTLVTNVSAGSTFHWTFEADIIITATGVSGKALGASKTTIGQTGVGNGSLADAGGNTTSTGTTIDTTAATTITLQANWASTTGAPTITSFYSTLERLGP